MFQSLRELDWEEKDFFYHNTGSLSFEILITFVWKVYITVCSCPFILQIDLICIYKTNKIYHLLQRSFYFQRLQVNRIRFCLDISNYKWCLSPNQSYCVIMTNSIFVEKSFDLDVYYIFSSISISDLSKLPNEVLRYNVCYNIIYRFQYFILSSTIIHFILFILSNM